MGRSGRPLGNSVMFEDSGVFQCVIFGLFRAFQVIQGRPGVVRTVLVISHFPSFSSLSDWQ
jgi:hypothetical protein